MRRRARAPGEGAIPPMPNGKHRHERSPQKCRPDAGKPARRASYSEVCERVRRARRMNLRELSMEQVASRIGLIMDGYRTMIRPVELNGAFRARKNVEGK